MEGSTLALGCSARPQSLNGLATNRVSSRMWHTAQVMPASDCDDVCSGWWQLMHQVRSDAPATLAAKFGLL